VDDRGLRLWVIIMISHRHRSTCSYVHPYGGARTRIDLDGNLQACFQFKDDRNDRNACTIAQRM